MDIKESTYYRRQHVTGVGCVLVSIKFGETPSSGVLVIKRLAQQQSNANIQFDLERHITEILEGVDEANKQFNGDLQVQEVEVVPDDFPQRGQAKSAAFKIAMYVLGKDVIK